MKTRKIMILVMILALVWATAIPAMGATAYPQDLLNTQLFYQARAFMDKGVITGDTDGLFHAERNITRAEFATIMAKATNNTNRVTAAEKQNYFSDLTGYGWAKGYINACYEAKLMNGTGNEKFNPAGSVSYVEVIAVISRARGVSQTTINNFGKWPNNYIKYAELYNLDGAVDVKNWTAAATKGEVVQLMYRNMPKSDVSAPTVTVTNTGTTLVATVTGTGTHTYQWYDNSGLAPVAVAGATGSSYAGTIGTYYFVRVTTQKSGYSDTVTDSTPMRQ